MIGARAKTRFYEQRLKTATDAMTFKNLGHAAATIRKIASRSIRRRKGPSRPGQPPHTQTGILKRAIVYAVDRPAASAVIGPSSHIGTFAKAHEFGGIFRGQRFAKRAFMGPALEKVRHRLPRQWANSLK